MKRKKGWTQSPVLLLLAMLFLAGLLAGIVYGRRSGGEGYLTYFVTEYLQNHLQGKFAPVFSVSFLSVISAHFLLFCLALSCVGPFVILFLPLLKGFSVGMISAMLCVQWGGHGILVGIAILWLPCIIQSVILLLFCWQALDISITLCKGTLLHRNTCREISLADLFEYFVLYSSAGLAAATLEGALAFLLGPLFTI
ncbi:MAG: hypothetical protein MSH10_02890 [Pygmaiobacter massiliensis]|nr:hypothetical protein [Pygmaiobacter massiliensis]